MAEPTIRKASPLNIAIDALLSAAAFCLFYWLAASHVSSDNPLQIALWGAYAAACMTGVFWLAWQMLKAVYRHQREVARAED
jgi:hypothetical protein